MCVDIAVVQAISEGTWVLGIGQSPWKRIRVHDGTNYIYTGSDTGLVPICLGVPDQAVVQPSVQPRASDPTYTSWWKEEQVNGIVLKFFSELCSIWPN